MSLENDENQALTLKDLTFILAIAGRIDAQCRIIASELDKDSRIYYAYAVFDSLSSSYSMFKYFFDVFFANNDADSMHDAMLTPGGIIAIIAETTFLVSFSFLAALFDNEKKGSIEKLIATAWPYFRDVMKALKNAYKGWRSAVLAVSFIGGLDLKSIISPIGLVLGLFAAANRLWLRRMVEKRKRQMSANAELLLVIKKLEFFSHEERIAYLKKIKYQSLESREAAFVAVAAGGLLDGLYLYGGVLSLAALAPSLFIAMSSVCIVFIIGCIVTRVYEEYDFQLRLFITQTKCKLALISKELETDYGKWLLLKDKINKTEVELGELAQLESNLCVLINKLEEKRALLKKQVTRNYLSAALFGMKNGLYAYSALASILFLVATILLLAGVAFPPGLVIGCIVTGLVFMIGFTLHSLITNYIHLKKQKNTEEGSFQHIIDMKNHLEMHSNEAGLDATAFKESLHNGLCYDASPQFFFQEWFEVFRSLFSGFGKGQKFADFSGNPLQEMDDQGHYHDTPIMYLIAAISSLAFGIILALRALAKGLGKTKPGQENQTAKKEPQNINVENHTEKKETIEKPGESNKSTPLVVDSQKSLNGLSFFTQKPKQHEPSPSQTRIQAPKIQIEAEDNEATNPGGIILGLG